MPGGVILSEAKNPYDACQQLRVRSFSQESLKRLQRDKRSEGSFAALRMTLRCNGDGSLT